jgi:UDP-N-acetylglucosamine 3-dehydrogenase
MRVAIIGCGNIGLKFHLPACQNEPGVTLVGAADPTPSRLELFREASGLDGRDCVTDYRVILDRSDVDAVIVCTPPAYRPPIVIAALHAGKHVLSEKPIALIPAEAWLMARTARETGRTLATVHNYHFLSDYAAVRRVLDTGIIGEPYVVTLNYLGVEDRPGASDYRPTWRHDLKTAGGGVLMDMLHAVYILAWLKGGPPRAVGAAVDRRLDSREAVEDLALCRYEFDRGFGMINMAWGQGPGSVEIMGTEGRLLVFYAGHATGPFVPAEQFHVYRGAERVPVEVDLTRRGAGGQSILSDFVASVAENREPLAPGERGAETLEAVVGAYESAYLDRKVSLPLDPRDPVYREGLVGLAALPGSSASQVAIRGLYGVE